MGLECTQKFCFLSWWIRFDRKIIGCFLCTQTSLPILAAILDFLRKRLFYGYFDITFSINAYFHFNEVKCNHIKLFVSMFASPLVCWPF